MSKYALIFFTLIIVPKCFGQIKRKIKYRDKVYEIYVQNNRMKNSTQIIPGMKVFIIIGASSDLDSIYNSDKLKNIPITGMNDYAIFYYLKAEQITETNDFLAFFKNMIEESYQEDFFDRNRVHLICRSFSREFLCQESYELSKIFSTITIQGENETSGCKNLFLNNEEIWERSKNKRSRENYYVPGLWEMDEINNQKAITAYRYKKAKVFYQITGGSNFINRGSQGSFDNGTLVDFSNFHTLWSMNAGYYFSDRWYGSAEGAAIYAGKKKSVNNIENTGDGITVSGSGSGGAMLRSGIGIGYIIYQQRKFWTDIKLSGGRLTAIAGGGNVTRTIGGGDGSEAAIITRNRTANYYAFTGATNLRLNNTFYLTGNLQYVHSEFKEPIGSVKGFSGISVNAGVGIFINIKKKKDE